ncbi:(4S)-4-hydroxy-5-phosphonooxypentane-2,3-dione isomerase [Vibrio brasiliensis]|jgi:autoinducer 2-degrading protein|uniref:(4S)-4-hydroxy-5-phosphonooxypentane-2,3-dione isomerase n=1 Tax=Vibrio brasiliensis TaxID=170652 RepID=UPI001EFDBCBB|nr:(4S)-4-hydroxy-5-phosphonooxypentane-2,3-dione isomerase [Vibrio brasiliensis]MCG9752036.1 (4S)-4-hydroxy-5-phosphonooxypentane-2,3-dione isomerase [Vibrio brasiliensis]MCG9781474.1 (4S)-4-hydroxy-5-phosphonooxypentane-2,3-dione isomerase [Vibrio brasiliensis]
MHVTLVEINVKPNMVERFKEVFLPNHLSSIEEEGNLRFDVLQDEEEPTRFVIYEAYLNEAAVLRHKRTAHYLKCVEELKPIMTGTRIKQQYCGLMIKS